MQKLFKASRVIEQQKANSQKFAQSSTIATVSSGGGFRKAGAIFKPRMESPIKHPRADPKGFSLFQPISYQGFFHI